MLTKEQNAQFLAIRERMDNDLATDEDYAEYAKLSKARIEAKKARATSVSAFKKTITENSILLSEIADSFDDEQFKAVALARGLLKASASKGAPSTSTKERKNEAYLFKFPKEAGVQGKAPGLTATQKFDKNTFISPVVKKLYDENKAHFAQTLEGYYTPEGKAHFATDAGKALLEKWIKWVETAKLEPESSKLKKRLKFAEDKVKASATAENKASVETLKKELEAAEAKEKAAAAKTAGKK